MESEFPNTSFKCQQLESERLQKGFTIVPKGTLILETQYLGYDCHRSWGQKDQGSMGNQ